ncbi:xanthine dehydrogenase family protein molybdopterin-binding subunit [Saccharothrix coeruleofusca]|uniref:Carbon-monoxide dehydrogenase large subunit n=1 Tax=Saccharothrix coeruleofusca TaxID=33919 RepID=A0A918ARM8_9PSEU|nr:molybdopterin cofactor-binding domain-containing protein [Saccharothrix coeruleofusca]GGP66736.1 carbon-monoxide dehydrogenase large subunit [Saccharothrix coeruleofusca]
MSPIRTALTSALTSEVTGGIGTSPRRPDGNLKVRGEFAYASDLWHEDMVWGATLRSPHPHARIVSVDLTEAIRVPGVRAVLTHEDVPGLNRYGLERKDQPVLAEGVVRYQGEPVALVAADHPETARRAMRRVKVAYEVLEPVVDVETAAGAAPLHPGGNLLRHVPVRRGDQAATAAVVVTGRYEVGMQDQAFLGPESGLAVPAEDGGVDLYVATQWLHVDREQVARALGMPEDKVRLTLSGVGGAFGGREDLSMQVHACLLALRTGRPVKMVYNREESFYGHVHRHPAVLHYEHGADRTGKLSYVKAKIYLDGGAYASSTGAVVANAATLGIGPYEVDNVTVDAWGLYTNNPPCGAMRGFGAVQAAFAYESQMDRLAAELGLHPVELRLRNAMAEGSVMPTGQLVDSAAPVARLLELVRDKPLPPPSGALDLRDMPGGVANTTHGEGVVRGVGYAVGIKNICFSEGYDDYSTARVRLQVVNGEPVAQAHTAACEVGQGLVTVVQQIVRTELGVRRVAILPMDTTIGDGGSTSASRQTYVTGGAVKAACAAVRAELAAMAGTEDLSEVDLAELLGDRVVDRTAEYRHRRTEPIAPVTGQGNAHVQYGFAAHRAVVDVDTELGLVKVVRLDCAQDVGRALNPQAVVGQIQGGSAQGLGLAVMEEIRTSGGRVRNPSFTDYLIPTTLDMPPMGVDVLELADPNAPYGVRGVGEPPTISSTPAIVAAIRAATGLALTRVPVRPEHITGT